MSGEKKQNVCKDGKLCCSVAFNIQEQTAFKFKEIITPPLTFYEWSGSLLTASVPFIPLNGWDPGFFTGWFKWWKKLKIVPKCAAWFTRRHCFILTSHMIKWQMIIKQFLPLNIFKYCPYISVSWHRFPLTSLCCNGSISFLLFLCYPLEKKLNLCCRYKKDFFFFFMRILCVWMNEFLHEWWFQGVTSSQHSTAWFDHLLIKCEHNLNIITNTHNVKMLW